MTEDQIYKASIKDWLRQKERWKDLGIEPGLYTAYMKGFRDGVAFVVEQNQPTIDEIKTEIVRLHEEMK